jgi:glycosyltransferase involved in cell wall biosynthesis
MKIHAKDNNDKKKHILVVGPDLISRGGISRVIQLWLEGNFFEDFQFDLVGSVGGAPSRKVSSSFKGILDFIKKLTHKPDLIYIHAATSISFYRKSIYILLASIFNIKTILQIHPNEFRYFYLNQSFLKRYYSRFILNNVNCFIVLNEDMKNFLQNIFPRKPVYLLRNPVNMKAMANKKKIRRRKDNLLYLGWYIPGKGIYELVDAMAILKQKKPSIHLNCFGTKKIDQFQNYVTDQGLSDVITVNDWINEQEKIHQFYSSTLLILPSHSEGIPNVILEAMATKTPIVTTAVGGIKDVLRDGETALFVRVNDPIDLSDKILMLLEDQQLRKHLAEQAYQEAAEKYDVSIIKENFKDILGRCL